MATTSLQKILEELQIKIMEQSVEEARLKTEKAKVELETAKLQQKYAQSLFMTNVPAKGGVMN